MGREFRPIKIITVNTSNHIVGRKSTESPFFLPAFLFWQNEENKIDFNSIVVYVLLYNQDMGTSRQLQKA